MGEFGIFTSIVGVALALTATFSMLLLKALGSLPRWTWLTKDSPPFLLTAGARAAAVAAMAATYIFIDPTNYSRFAIAAGILGVSSFVLVAVFDYLRRLDILAIPVVGKDGKQLADAKGRPRYENVVIGSESEMREEAKRDLKKARQQYGGISLVKFMSGYGAKVNDPEAIWDRTLLSRKGSRLAVLLMCIMLSAVLTLFLAAFVIDVKGRATQDVKTSGLHAAP